MQLSPASLAVILSRLKPFPSIDHKLEQYQTPSEIAARFLWDARNDIAHKKVIDLGAGTGILGLGAALLGAQVVCIEKDPAAFAVLEQNASYLEELYGPLDIKTVCADVLTYSIPKVDTIIMNPPFGTKDAGIDKKFLKIACEHSDVVWSMHKTSTIRHLERFAKDNGCEVAAQQAIKFPIPKTHRLHTKPTLDVEVSIMCFRKF